MPPRDPHGRLTGLGGLIIAERGLKAAPRRGDVEALDQLLHTGVVAMGPDGSTFTKEDDLETHRSGALRIVSLVERSVDVRQDGPTGVTRTVADIQAVQDGVAAAVRFRYTRLWVWADGRWQVLAAAFGPADGSAATDPTGQTP